MLLVTTGKMNKQVAGDLGISEITVKIHRGAVMRKMGARTLADLIRQLREAYDLVVLDSPPLLQVGDAMTLSSAVDAVIVLTRLRTLRKGMLGDLRRATFDSLGERGRRLHYDTRLANGVVQRDVERLQPCLDIILITQLDADRLLDQLVSQPRGIVRLKRHQDGLIANSADFAPRVAGLVAFRQRGQDPVGEIGAGRKRRGRPSSHRRHPQLGRPRHPA